MGTRPLILLLVSACLTLAPAEQNDERLNAEIMSILGLPTLNNDSGSNSGNNFHNRTIFGFSLPMTTANDTTENQKESLDTNCTCVPYYLCRNGSVTTAGQFLLYPRYKRDVCENYLEVCCKLPEMIPEIEVVEQTYYSKGCGVRNPNGVGNITGLITENNEVQFGEFPWIVAIVTTDLNTTKLTFQCGGSLIHKKAVLTAAHCVQGKKPHELKIRAGEWDTGTKNENLPHQDRNVKSVIIHEKFHAGTLFYDFAILILSEPVDFAENVDVVCLPEKDAVFDGSRCFTTGWGDGMGKDNAEGQYQVILKEVELPIMPHDTCENSLRNTILGKHFVLHDSFICGGGESMNDTCKGDGGSPLVCPSKKDPTRYQQVGIVAWEIACNTIGIPGVYANVAYARNWIDKQMASKDLDNTFYAL